MLDLRPIFRNSRFAQRVQVLRCHGQYLADGTWQQEYFWTRCWRLSIP